MMVVVVFYTFAVVAVDDDGSAVDVIFLHLVIFYNVRINKIKNGRLEFATLYPINIKI